MWTFCCLDGKSAIDNLWHDWFSQADEAAQACHEVRFSFMETRPQIEWRHYTRALGGGLIEIKIPGDVQWRLLGFFGPGANRFTFVLACHHKQKRYYPHQDAIKLAKKLMNETKANPSRAVQSVRPT
jgi:hypothetical protein